MFKALTAIFIILFVQAASAVEPEIKAEQIIRNVAAEYGDEAGKRVEIWRKMIALHEQFTPLERVKKVNTFFNYFINVDDAEVWGQDDYWATPIEFIGQYAGDSEEFSTAKYFTLLEMGIEADALKLVFAKSNKASSQNNLQLVLAYYPSPNQIPFILDSTTTALKRANERPDIVPIHSLDGKQLWQTQQKTEGNISDEQQREQSWKSLESRYKLDKLVDVEPATQLDVLVYYNQALEDEYKGNALPRIRHLMSVTNQIFATSNLPVTLKVVGTRKVNYSNQTTASEALNQITLLQGEFTDRIQLQLKYGADLVVLMRSYEDSQEGCAASWLTGYQDSTDFTDYKDFMVATIAANTCGDYTLAHALGHNLGIAHSRNQDGRGRATPYGLGYGVENEFVTVMAFHGAYNVDFTTGKLYQFSNAEMNCKDFTCGVAVGEAGSANAVAAMKISAPNIADLYKPSECMLAEHDNIKNDNIELGLAELTLAEKQAEYRALLVNSPIMQTTQNANLSKEARISAAKQAYMDANKAVAAILRKLDDARTAQYEACDPNAQNS
ncbi:reprolysin-like metallopeptidase [Flocculibacter collagenilyticus]|uniref:reprolysin-like metallopeptidase n=1 Tax=Flocculibacter collagenilyticus TaxID=2744479 RepID=UPI0018F5856C|nr:zinc-dependent metalloprotease family protein [Flocculibacter collagenilyticus]